MNRPQDLHLLPDETYPTDRLASEEIKSAPLVVKNMTQMADFTFKLYMQKVESMKEAMVGFELYTVFVRRNFKFLFFSGNKLSRRHAKMCTKKFQPKTMLK